MKKILITRKLLRSSEDKASKIFDTKFNTNDELYSQEKLIKMSEGCDGILSALTDKLDAEKTFEIYEQLRPILPESKWFQMITSDTMTPAHN